MENPKTHLNEITKSLRQSGLYREQQAALLVRAWEAAVEGTLENGTLENGTLENGTLENGTLENGTLEDGILTLRSLHRPDLNPRK